MRSLTRSATTNERERKMNTIEKPCDDCDAVTVVTIEPYGASKMATIECPNCGTSYDTNLDEVEGE